MGFAEGGATRPAALLPALLRWIKRAAVLGAA